MKNIKIELHKTEQRLLTELRTLRRGLRGTRDGARAAGRQLTLGQRIADAVAATMGSWTFIIIQSVLLLFWIALNVTAYGSNGIPTRSSCSIWRSRSKPPMPRPSS